MKTKKFNKRLSLKKATVVNLNTNQLDDVRGGAITIGHSCETCDPRFCWTKVAPTCLPSCPVTCPIEC